MVFITGAARGIGAELARQAYDRQALVSLVGRSRAPLERLAAEFGARAVVFEADVRDFVALQAAAAGTVKHFGGIDVVVANAGILPPADTVLTIDPKVFERTIDVDLLGQWRTIRATLPAVIQRRGHLLVVASIYAFFNGALTAGYAASKAGLEQLARAIRVELVHHGVTVGVAYLGYVDTDMVAEAFAQDHVRDALDLLPAFVSRPIPVGRAASAVIDGIERRASRVGAPSWVLPLLATRGIGTSLMDELLIRNTRLARIIDRFEASKLVRQRHSSAQRDPQ